MKIGFIGLGKLGLPVALATKEIGHQVAGWDTSKIVRSHIRAREITYREEGAQELLDSSKIKLMRPSLLAEWADLVFVAVQTPHQPEFEGVTRLPEHRADFDYTYLRKAVESVLGAKLTVIISTVLPGTVERFFGAGIADPEKTLYNPFFIAMGTTIADFRSPEFVLVGTDHAHPGPLRDFYSSVHDRPVFISTIKTAELTKVAYNTFIGLKIAFANTMMELCEKTGADVDDLVDALSLADQRIISTAYMRGGMGDGGGCHPRDNIALSWLARKLDLSYDLFAALMECREAQTEWLADMCPESVTILGESYKPGTNLTVGSPAVLLANILEERGIDFKQIDPHTAAN